MNKPPGQRLHNFWRLRQKPRSRNPSRPPNYALRGFIPGCFWKPEKSALTTRKPICSLPKPLFATLTNVNFDPDSITRYLKWTVEAREALKVKVKAAGGKADWAGAANLALEKSIEGMTKQANSSALWLTSVFNPDLRGLHWLLTYGIKGVAAYAYHAFKLGQKDDKVFEFIEQGLVAPLDNSLGVNDFLGLSLKCGEINIRAMELLDAGNTGTYGHPVPTKVPWVTRKAKQSSSQAMTSKT